MNTLRKDDIRLLTENNSYPSVSIFIPTHKEWNGLEQDKTRYKNLLNKVEKKLSEFMREKELKNYLKSAKDLLNDNDFWNHQDLGLAIYFNKEEFRTIKLPEPVDEFLFINSTYYIKPLLPVLNGDGRFFLLSFDQKKTKLFECTKYRIEELKIPDTITSFDELMKFYDAERSVQFHSSTGQTTAKGKTGDRSAMFHGHGSGGDDAVHKKNLLDFAHVINKGVHKVIKDETAPLIVAAVEYLIPIYKKANSYPHLYEKHLPINTGGLKNDELRSKAWEIIKPVFQTSSKKAFGKYEQFSGNEKASSNIEDIIKASLSNKIEYLWVNLDEQQWGVFNDAEQRIEFDEKSNPENKDLLDFAAAQTLLNNGTVYALKGNDMPVRKPALAVFRY